MSQTIDDRIVRMTFDTNKFQNGVKGVLDGLKNIDKSLGSKRTFGGLDAIGRSISDVTNRGMSELSRSINDSAGRFSALEIAGVTALANITNRAVNAGVNLAKALTIDPIMDGFNEYELKMNSISTILTNTASHGTKLSDVNAALNELNEYSDKTIYNFAQMTDNIGKATAAGLGLGDAVDFVKGMANTAAAFGVDATKMAGATYQMTQALSSGSIKAIDWMSMEQAGMGGKLLQDKLIANAKAAGKEFSLAGTSFKGSLEQGWLTADIFAKTMGEIANDDTLTKKAGEVTSLTKLFGVLQEAVGSGWAATFEQIFGDKNASTKLFTNINDAITNGLITPLTKARKAVVDTWLSMNGRENTIKAFSNIWENLSRIIGPIGAAFNKIFPATFGATLGYISKGFLKLTESLMISKEFSGFIGDAFTVLFTIINTGVKVIGFLLQPLKLVFNLFTAVARGVGNVIVAFIKMAYAIGGYISKLTIVKDAQKAFNSGLEFIQSNADKFVKAFDSATKSVGDFFNNAIETITAFFGTKDKTDGVSKSFDSVVKSSGAAGKAMGGIKNAGDLVNRSFEGIKNAGSDIKKIFDDAKSGAKNSADGFITFVRNTKTYIANSGLVAGATKTMANALKTMSDAGSGIGDFIKSINFSPIVNTFNGIKETLGPLIEYISNIFNVFVRAFRSLFDELDLTGGQLIALLGGFAAGFGVFKILGKISDLIGKVLNPIGNLSDAAVGVLDGVKGVLQAYQNDLKAETLKKIGVAVLMLSAGLLILSQLELSQVQTGLLGVVGILASVVTAMAVLITITSGANLKGFFSLSAAFISISIAVLNMSLAIMLLSSLGMDKLSTGLIGVAGGITIIVLALGAVGTMSGSIVKGAFAMTLVANALNLMFIALMLFAKMDTQVMNNSLMSIGMALAVLVYACRGLNSVTGDIIKTSIGLTILSGALIILASATKKFGELDTGVIFKGLMSITIIMAALILFNKSTANSKMSFSMGVGMMGLAKAMDMLVKPIEKFGSMNTGQLVKGILSLGLVMGSLALMTKIIRPEKGLQLIMVSLGLIAFAKAIEMFSETAAGLKDMDTGALISGLFKMGLAIGAIALAVSMMPQTQLITLAVGIAALSLALRLMTSTLSKAGSIPFKDIVKGITALFGALLILEGATRLTSGTSLIKLGIGLSAIALGFTAMTLPLSKLGSMDFEVLAKGLGTLLAVIGLITLMNNGMAGMSLMSLAAGITLMSLALTSLYIPINLLGSLDLKTIGVGLLAITGVLAVLAISAALMAPLVPVLFGLASSITLLGTGMLAAAGGLALFAGGFALFGMTVANYGNAIIAFIVTFMQKLPELVTNIGLAFVALLEVLSQNRAVISESIFNILTAIIDAIIKVIPLVGNAITNLIVTLVETLASSYTKISAAGFKLIMALLDGLNKYVGPIVSKMIEILITMANTLMDNLNILVDAGIKLIISLLNGMAQGIDANSAALSEAFNNLIFSLLDALVEFGDDFLDRGAEFVVKMIKGLFDGKSDVKTAGTSVAKSGVDGAKATKKDWTGSGENFSAGLAKGISNGKSGIVTAAINVAKAAAAAIKKALDINSPSRVTTGYGKFTSMGLAVGIKKFGFLAVRAASKVANDTAKSIAKPINNIAMLDGINVDPVVRPVMDLSNVISGSRTIGSLINSAAGTISSFGSINGSLVTNVGNIQNGTDNSDIINAITKLKGEISNIKGNTYNVNGLSYDDGSNVSSALETLVRAAKIERRT